MVPGQFDRPAGCTFAPRCEYAVERCRREAPLLAGAGAERVRCHFPLNAEGRPTNGWTKERADSVSGPAP
jgi:dipeptide transport system ATP-binding protein